jgi:hypothetical protein
MAVNGELHNPAALPSRKITHLQLNRRVAGPQNRSGRSGEEENLFSMAGIEQKSSVIQPAASSMYQLS